MRTRCFVIAFSLALLVPSALPAMDINDLAYESRIHLEAGTIWNPGGAGDCLLYPYFDVRETDGKTQVTQINIENTGEYGIAAKLRFRDWARGKEIFSKDIWIPTKGLWTARIEMNGDGTNAIITGSGNVISKSNANTFYFTNSLLGGASFSTKNIRRGLGESTLCGFVEVIGEEKTAPDDKGGQTGRLAASEQDCPNTLKGSLSITRVEDGATMAYDAVAIGNFSRGQGSLFRTPGSPFPRLDNGEDSLDQIEFQLSKFEVFGPFSVTPSNQGKTSFIVTFPTKFFHYASGRRINKINNPFKAQTESRGETLKSSLSQNGAPLLADSELTLPYSVNVIGLYQGSGSPPSGIDNLVLPVYSFDSGDLKFTSENMAQRILIQDFEYLKEMFTTYRGLPALGLVLREYRNPDVLHPSITPAEFSAVWEASSIESVTFPTFIDGPSFGAIDTGYTYTTGGAVSTIGHPIQYQFDWGDGSPVNDTTWLDIGVTGATHKYAAGGAYGIFTRARCVLHPNLVSKWSKGLVVVIESISPPSFLAGQVVGIPNTLYTYTTGGASTNVGNPVQYFFDWGDGTDSNWLAVGTTSAQKTWATGGTYSVKARARDSVNPTIVSTDTTLVVNIDLISTPSSPVGPTTGNIGDTSTYMTGGASSNIGNPVEYQFDWGDGTFSGWLTGGGTSAQKTWTKGGNFSVRAQARDAIHPSIVSAWSSGLTVIVNNPSPTLTSIFPNYGTLLQTLNVIFTGTNFIAGASSVNFGAGITVNSTSVNSATSITANITITAAATAGTRDVSVTNAAPGGGTATLTNGFTVFNPGPTTTGISPTTKTVGDPGFSMSVNGTNFVQGAVVQFNGSDRVTTFGSSTLLTAAILDSDLTTAGTFNITVFNPGPGGGTSNAQTFTVDNPVPTTSGIVPTNKNAGDLGFPLTVNGTKFVSASVVQFNGSARVTTFVSSTQLTAAILDSDLTAPGTFSITVSNPAPGGGTSNAQTFTVN